MAETRLVKEKRRNNAKSPVCAGGGRPCGLRPGIRGVRGANYAVRRILATLAGFVKVIMGNVQGRCFECVTWPEIYVTVLS